LGQQERNRDSGLSVDTQGLKCERNKRRRSLGQGDENHGLLLWKLEIKAKVPPPLSWQNSSVFSWQWKEAWTDWKYALMNRVDIPG
jgi:hypothetical protein